MMSVDKNQQNALAWAAMDNTRAGCGPSPVPAKRPRVESDAIEVLEDTFLESFSQGPEVHQSPIFGNSGFISEQALPRLVFTEMQSGSNEDALYIATVAAAATTAAPAATAPAAAAPAIAPVTVAPSRSPPAAALAAAPEPTAVDEISIRIDQLAAGATEGFDLRKGPLAKSWYNYLEANGDKAAEYRMLGRCYDKQRAFRKRWAAEQAELLTHKIPDAASEAERRRCWPLRVGEADRFSRKRCGGRLQLHSAMP